MANGNNPPSKGRGKGGNFDTRPNPFGNVTPIRPAPDMAGVSLLGSTLDKVLRAGCALMVGHTRDGGAVVLTVLDGENRHRTYCSSDEELDAAFERLEAMYTPD